MTRVYSAHHRRIRRQCSCACHMWCVLLDHTSRRRHTRSHVEYRTVSRRDYTRHGFDPYRRKSLKQHTIPSQSHNTAHNPKPVTQYSTCVRTCISYMPYHIHVRRTGCIPYHIQCTCTSHITYMYMPYHIHAHFKTIRCRSFHVTATNPTT